MATDQAKFMDKGLLLENKKRSGWQSVEKRLQYN